MANTKAPPPDPQPEKSASVLSDQDAADFRAWQAEKQAKAAKEAAVKQTAEAKAKALAEKAAAKAKETAEARVKAANDRLIRMAADRKDAAVIVEAVKEIHSRVSSIRSRLVPDEIDATHAAGHLILAGLAGGIVMPDPSHLPHQVRQALGGESYAMRDPAVGASTLVGLLLGGMRAPVNEDGEIRRQTASDDWARFASVLIQHDHRRGAMQGLEQADRDRVAEQNRANREAHDKRLGEAARRAAPRPPPPANEIASSKVPFKHPGKPPGEGKPWDGSPFEFTPEGSVEGLSTTPTVG